MRVSYSTLWKPLPTEIKEIRELSRCIDALKIQHNQISNQLEKKSSKSKFVTKTWEELVFRVEKELKNLYDEVRYAAWQK
jgi:hypothetical protein